MYNSLFFLSDLKFCLVLLFRENLQTKKKRFDFQRSELPQFVEKKGNYAKCTEGNGNIFYLSPLQKFISREFHDEM